MNLRIEQRNLFEVGPEWTLAHCISGDFALGAGIAKEFEERYNMKDKLNCLHGYLKNYDSEKVPIIPSNRALKVNNVFNLVTKRRYFHKPTLESLKDAIESMANQIDDAEDIDKLAMPMIGCGLDKLDWDDVEEIIHEVFEDFDDLEILICHL